MNRVALGAIGLAASAVCSSGCSSSGPSSSSTPTPPSVVTATATAFTPTAAAMVKVAGSPLGQILVDGSGRTLYLFEADTGTTSTCNGACAAAWPPETTKGAAVGSGVNASMLGTTNRSDHTTQVTYNGHPLYYFAADTTAGQTNGQGVNAFGALWYAVSPGGTPVTTKASGSASASSTGGVY